MKTDQTPTPQKTVVFILFRPARCSECGTELDSGNLAILLEDRSLCLSCADLDHLVFLPSGDTALTRRATRHSVLSAVVVKFSRARRRNERQGTLVEEAALTKAEEECGADEESRTRARERAAVRREQLDAGFVAAFNTCIGEAYPGCLPAERKEIAEHACRKHSGRVGRSAAAKRFEADTVKLAVQAHVRHVHTRYDQLLASGMPRPDARREVGDKCAAVLRNWRVG